jgi:hypothetical protein
LFRLPEIGEHLIFKGGTSLSKVFKVIERFSEDIDVSIDRSYLGFGGANEPEAGASNKEKQRRIEALKAACQRKIGGDLLPALQAAIKSKVRHDETGRCIPTMTTRTCKLCCSIIQRVLRRTRPPTSDDQ